MVTDQRNKHVNTCFPHKAAEEGWERGRGGGRGGEGGGGGERDTKKSENSEINCSTCFHSADPKRYKAGPV